MALVALAGCDKVLSLNDIKPPTDAAYLDCTKLSPPPYLCADFDVDPGFVYENGVAAALPNQPTDVTVQRVLPYVSPPYALWIDSKNPPYFVDDTQSSPTVTQLIATFALAVTRASDQDAELFELGVNTPALDCYAQLFIKADPTTPSLWVKSACPTPQEKQVLSTLPAALAPVAMTFDAAAGMTIVHVERVDTVLTMGFVDPTGGTPHVRFGMLATGGAGPKVGYDDVIVTLP